MPSPEFDNSDPLGALMTEWRQTATWFWFGLAAAIGAALLLPDVAFVVAIAAVGFPLIQLGHTVVIVGNELRKNQRAAGTQADEGL